MNKVVGVKRFALVFMPVLLAHTGVAQADTAEQLAVCKTELKALVWPRHTCQNVRHEVLPGGRDTEA